MVKDRSGAIPEVGILVSSPSMAPPVRLAPAGCAMAAVEWEDRTSILFSEEPKIEIVIRPDVKYDEIILIELWAGVASLSQAFEEQGIRPAAFSEIDTGLLQRLKNKHRKALFTGDFNSLEWRSWTFNKGAIIIVVGGPPCTALSSAGKRLMQWDKASDGILQTLELAHFFGAHLVVVENVPELVTEDWKHGLLSAAICFAGEHHLECVAMLSLRDSEFGGFTQRLRAFKVDYWLKGCIAMVSRLKSGLLTLSNTCHKLNSSPKASLQWQRSCQTQYGWWGGCR